MSPISGVTDGTHWYPRLGKIRLGIKKQGQKGPYPSATDYFVCPEAVQKIYGEKPTELDVMFPSEKIELIAPAWMKCYSYSQGKICEGDGRTTCRRKVDTDTGDFANKETKHWEWVEASCDVPHCPMIGDKQCRKMMSLLFLLPKVPGIGIWQLDTSSYDSIRNIYSMLDSDPEHEGFIRHFTRGGTISSLPLKLSVGPQEVITPDTGRKTVYVLSVRSEMVLADQIRYSLKSAAQVLLPTLDDNEPPDDLYPEDALHDAEETRLENEQAKKEMSEGSLVSPEKSTSSPAPAAAPAVQTPDKDWEALGRTDQEKAAAAPKSAKQHQSDPNSSIKPREEWDKVTQKDVSGYPELESIFCRLTLKSNRDMYRELGGGGRTDQTIPAWDAFLNLKHSYYPSDMPK